MKIISVLLCMLWTQITYAADLLPVPPTPGTYKSASWTYIYIIDNSATRSEARTGKLFYKDTELVAPYGSVLNTPFGSLMFFSSTKIHGWGEHGWLSIRCYDKPVFTDKGEVVSDLKKDSKEVDLKSLLKSK